jgi:hypothetical protein
MTAARVADTKYRAAHDGRPITRDELRIALRIAGPKATELRRRLANESAAPTPVPVPTEAPEQTGAPDRKEAYSTA